MPNLTRGLLGSLLFAGCASSGTPAAQPPLPQGSATDTRLAALAPTRLRSDPALAHLDDAISSYFARSGTRRSYIQTDKPLYQPGETIWFRADLRATGTLLGQTSGLTMQLVSPRGAVVATKRVLAKDGVGANDFALAPDLDGGEYTIKLVSDDGTTDDKKIIVASYEAPRLQKTVELLRKAYGEGDQVTAAIEVKRPTGEPFAGKPLSGIVTVDDQEIARVQLVTDKDGKAAAHFQLPAHIAHGDGLFTLLADDGGVTESIQKRIPIVLHTLQLSMFPEGGDLVEGLPGRVYFAARNTMGKPADVEGRVLDDRGELVAKVRSIHDGMGSFELQPQADRSYHLEIDKPAGITAKFDVPAAKDGGCELRSVPGGGADHLRVAVTCTVARTVLVEAVLRAKRLAGGALDVKAGAPSLVELAVPASAQGAVRVTLFAAKDLRARDPWAGPEAAPVPLAERLVYHGRGEDLKITLTADRKQYAPRDPVTLHLRTTDPDGKPVAASVGLAVVDDTVLSFADDKSAALRAHLYLEPELGATDADPIEEPNYYFSDKPDAAAAMDALLATRGYRRFVWQPVFNPPPPPPVSETTAALDENGVEGGAMPMGRAALAPMPMRKAPMHLAHAERGAAAVGGHGRDRIGGGFAKDIDRPAPPPVDNAKVIDGRFQGLAVAGKRKVLDGDLARADDGADDGLVANGEWQGGWAPVRVFPVPQYTRGYDGPRTDFRETIYWNPDVKTSAAGTADVTFVTSDAIAAFRATAEGVSAGGVPGEGQAELRSKMPLSLDAHLPVEVTSGDEIQLPITITNETDGALDAQLAAQFGTAFQLASVPDALHPAGAIHLAPHAQTTLAFPLRVVATDGDAKVNVTLSTLGLHDELAKTIHVVPRGFPFEVSASGTARPGAPERHDFDLTGALPGSMDATVTMYPSPLASMTQGMAALIREPGGCFEQTSSTNYPNVMIMSYLAANDASDATLVAHTEDKLEHGYKLLTGYETPSKGYEWFGHTPGHEALTAYGLMEFSDMSKVYGVDHAMVERTAAWLMTRRDGKGGFKRSAEALDSFGRASETTTNAYIMWALAEAKRTTGLDKELAVQKDLGTTTKDPYLLSLATNTALLTGAAEAHGMVERLVAMQAKDGSFPGAKESITMSGGESLTIETTSLAALALIKASPNDEYEPALRSAVAWLDTKRSGFGEWSNTQGTILALKALTAYSDHARQMRAAGEATLVINGEPAGTIAFDKGRKDALVWNGLGAKLRPGHNTIELRLAGGGALPYTMAVSYRAARPQSSPAAKVSVTTQLATDHVKAGEGVKLRARVVNKTAGGIPMTIARVGIPGGLVFQTWQLKELRDKGLVDFYETRPREVVLYWRALPPNAVKDVELDLLASVPGTYEAPATSAYLYYTAEDKAWAPPVQVTVTR